MKPSRFPVAPKFLENECRSRVLCGSTDMIPWKSSMKVAYAVSARISRSRPTCPDELAQLFESLRRMARVSGLPGLMTTKTLIDGSARRSRNWSVKR